MSPAGLPWDHPDADPLADMRAYINNRGRPMIAPSITCPNCGRTSYHPMDISQGYCGACHDWTSGVDSAPRLCPECEQGKHTNCDGSAWDSERDAPAICPCWKEGHKL